MGELIRILLGAAPLYAGFHIIGRNSVPPKYVGRHRKEKGE